MYLHYLVKEDITKNIWSLFSGNTVDTKNGYVNQFNKGISSFPVTENGVTKGGGAEPRNAPDVR